MSVFKKFDQFITRQNWDHLRFLRSLTLSLGLVVLFGYVLILILLQSPLAETSVMFELLIITTRGYFIGILCGLLTGFMFLLPDYLAQEWDQHKVVPRFLALVTIFIVLIWLLLGLFSVDRISQFSLQIGLVLGQLLAIIAYLGEIQKEHS